MYIGLNYHIISAHRDNRVVEVVKVSVMLENIRDRQDNSREKYEFVEFKRIR